MRTAKFFERAKNADIDPAVDSDPYAVTKVKLSADGKERELAVVGASGQVLFFRFKRKETPTETRSVLAKCNVQSFPSHHAERFFVKVFKEFS